MVDEKHPKRKRVRAPHWDYRQAGSYSVTICADNRECLFGSMREGKVELTAIGRSVEEAWRDLPKHYSNIVLDEFVVMPNHFHGILVISDSPYIHHDAGIKRSFGNIEAGSLSSIIRAFKAGVTRNAGGRIWQTGFHEHVIRDENDLCNHRQYIRNNPARWEFDRENPDFVGP